GTGLQPKGARTTPWLRRGGGTCGAATLWFPPSPARCSATCGSSPPGWPAARRKYRGRQWQTTRRWCRKTPSRYIPLDVVLRQPARRPRLRPQGVVELAKGLPHQTAPQHLSRHFALALVPGLGDALQVGFQLVVDTDGQGTHGMPLRVYCIVLQRLAQPLATGHSASMAPQGNSPVTQALPLNRYTFTVRALQSLRLPDYAGSMLRGAFGHALRRVACMTRMKECTGCPLLATCPYSQIFETPPLAHHALQKFSAMPNPYVIEPPEGGARVLAEGDTFSFSMVL